MFNHLDYDMASKKLPHLRILSSILLLAGCASEPPLTPSDSQAQVPSYRDQAVYNQPYTVKGKTYFPLLSRQGYREVGLASWYGAESGGRTANGNRFKPNGLTAAHKTLPIPSKVRVTNLANGRHIDVTVNDRGPFVDARLIDLSRGAAKRIGVNGLAQVSVEILDAASGSN